MAVTSMATAKREVKRVQKRSVGMRWADGTGSYEVDCMGSLVL